MRDVTGVVKKGSKLTSALELTQALNSDLVPASLLELAPGLEQTLIS